MNISRRGFCRNALLAGVVSAGISLLGALGAPSCEAQEKNERPVLLTLLHTNDLHGHVYLPDETTGLTRIASMVRRIRQEMPNVLLLDAGDIIHSTPEEKVFEGKPVISAMNALGYDAATTGNHEFDFGQRINLQARHLAQFPFLSANVLDEKTGRPWGGMQPYIVREIEGVRVAIFGLTTTGTVPIEFPRTLQGIRFADPIETARVLAPRLREQERADVVIALTHLGYKVDQELATVPGIDVILGGHSHTRLEKQVWVNGTLIQQTGSYARALGRVDLLIERDAAGKARLTINGQEGRWWGRDGVAAPLGKTYPSGPLLDPTAETAHDAAVLAAYLPYREDMNRRRAEVLTTALEPLPAEGAKTGATALGILLAEAVRAKFQADVGAVPSGAIAKGLPVGTINVGQAWDTIGGYTRQHIVTARVPGVQLREFVQRALQPGQYAAQVSGLAQHADRIEINGQPLRDDAFYTVAGTAYLIQDQFLGRDGVTILNDDPEATTTREAFVEFLRGHKPLQSSRKQSQ